MQSTESNDEDVGTEHVPPCMTDFFNVRMCYTKDTVNNKLTITRIQNALIEALKKKDTLLPKYLFMVIDKDLISDLPITRHDYMANMTQYLVSWLVRQINSIICRKRVDLFDKKPGNPHKSLHENSFH